MITVTRLDEYYRTITNKRERVYYRLTQLKQIAKQGNCTPVGIKTYRSILQALNRVMRMLRQFGPHDYISVDADGHYTISDNYHERGGGEYMASGKFDSILGGMQG